MIKVVVIEPGKSPEVKEIIGDLKSMQSVVGGYIECVPFSKAIDIWANEEGLLLDLPFNCHLFGQPIVGTIFAASHDNDGNTIGLTDSQIKKVMDYFNR